VLQKICSLFTEIQLFCAGTATAIFFDYLYQLFLFTPVLALVGEWEMREQLKAENDNKASFLYYFI
jgi:hypothetical protein